MRKYHDEKGRRYVTAADAAGRAVLQAIEEGKLSPARTKKCRDCGVPAQCYDHRDYLKPLDIEPVCRRCNKKRGPGLNANLRLLKVGKREPNQFNLLQSRMAIERRQKAASLRAAGYKLHEIGKLFGCSKQRIYALLKQYDEQMPNDK